MEEKGKRLKTKDGDGDGDGDGAITRLPEVLIQHIQSFLTQKDAARTTVLSKPWYEAWLTRSTLDFDQSRYRYNGIRFGEFSTKTMQRYEDSNLKIDRYRLRTTVNTRRLEILFDELIVKGVEIGATDLNLELEPAHMFLPREILESETLVRLSVIGRRIDDESDIRCLGLKSLTLDRVVMKSNDVFGDIVSRCVLIEELSLSHCRISHLGGGKGRSKVLSLGNSMNSMYELRKLVRLCLVSVDVGTLFSISDFGSRFPLLKDVFVEQPCCTVVKSVKIASTSLERISLLKMKATPALTVEIEAPNLVEFSYSGQSIPSLLCIESSRERESTSISIAITQSCITTGRVWFQRLRNLFTKLSPSKISLSIDASCYTIRRDNVVEGGVGESPLALEELKIAGYHLDVGLVLDLFRFCRPKFIVVAYRRWEIKETKLCYCLCKRMEMKDMIDPDEDMFGEFGLEQVVKLQIYKETLKEWQPLTVTQLQTKLYSHQGITMAKIRFELRWAGMN